MSAKTKKIISSVLTYGFLCLFSIVMIYPFIWMVLATFKSNSEIFGGTNLLPAGYSFAAYAKAWKGIGQYTYATYFMNTLLLVLPTVFFTIISCTLVAYGFVRFKFPFKKVLFALMISTLMLPNSVIIVPRYLLFNSFGWLNTYLPFWIPAALACFPFFIFMIVQFLRGLPRELDESAYIDGCNSFVVLYKILLPLMKPALFSTGLFQFMWCWNDFFNPLIYINSVKKYPIALGMRISLDAASSVNWNEVMCLSLVSMLPLIILFFFAQKYFVEGIATTGLKG